MSERIKFQVQIGVLGPAVFTEYFLCQRREQ